MSLGTITKTMGLGMTKMKLLYFFLVFLSLSHAKAYEFKYLKLKGPLKDLQEEIKSPSQGMRAFGDRPTKALNEAIIAKRILDLDLPYENREVQALSEPTYSDEKMSLLYQKIKEVLGKNYNEIGNEQTGPLIARHQFGGGLLNFSGFTYQKPMGNFTLGVNREIVPDLFSSNYIVHDVFVIGIDATTFLTNMKEAELIDIPDSSIGAFAGISFYRTYHYYHFAATYIEGLTKDYSKLFLPFTKYNENFVLDMPPYEIMKKQDAFTFNVGGIVNVPIGYGFGFEGGVLAEVSYKRDLTIQSLGDNDQKKAGEFLRVSLDKKFKAGVDIHLGLQLDFFNLLKLSILTYDFEYSLEDSNKYAVSFFEQDRENLKQNRSIASNDGLKTEFQKIITGKQDTPNLYKDHIVQLEQRRNENLNSKFSFLVIGDVKKKQTEKVSIIEDGIETIFFKHYSESLKIIQNFWSKLFSSAIFKLFKFDLGVKNMIEESKTFAIEYLFNDHLNGEKVLKEEDFSITLTQEFYAASTDKWYQKSYKKEAIKQLEEITNLSPDYSVMIRNDELKGPIQIKSNLRVEKQGLSYFHSLSEDKIFEALVTVCAPKVDIAKWLDKKRRDKALKAAQVGKHLCVKNLGLSYISYRDSFKESKAYDLLKLKKFITSYFRKTNETTKLSLLFGKNNVFQDGSFMATMRSGLPYQTYFKEGDFRGLGVIDNFSRKNGTTSPLVNIIN